jgi:CubicO group peptidase (beta-lactamase class C family)
MSSADLADALEFAQANDVNIHSITVVRNGYVVLDAYFYPFVPNTRHDIASATKSVVSMLAGLATAQGSIRAPEQTLLSALPPEDAKGVSDGVARIKLGDLLSMRSGFDCGFKRGEPELTAMRGAADWVAYTLRLPMIAEPGTRFGYCSPNFHLLSAALGSSTGESALEFARRNLFAPLGITDVYWPADGRGITRGWGDLQLRPHDMAKLGLLMLRDGQWEGRQILPKAWVDRSVRGHSPANDSNDYGFAWWMPYAIPGLFEAVGRGGQRISVLPEKSLVVVMTGGGFEPGDIGRYLTRAIRSDAPLPADPANQTRLTRLLLAIAAAPAHRAAPAVPRNAKRASGRVYELGTSIPGIRSFAVDFVDRDTSVLHLWLPNGEELVQPLGMDGRYRLTSVDGGALSAGRARWFEDGRLRIEFNRLSLINRFEIDVEFEDRNARVVFAEPTELGTVGARGVARE